MTEHIFKHGDYRNHPPPIGTSLMIADPVYGDTIMINELADLARVRSIPTCIFMWPRDLCSLCQVPNQICHWIKPISTKNTSKNYSNFVEVIALYGVKFHRELHWANRSGIFVDQLFTNTEHEWKKPESLIERLIQNHYSGEGIIYDPCAGSRTVETVCMKLDIPSFSVDLGIGSDKTEVVATLDDFADSLKKGSA